MVLFAKVTPRHIEGTVFALLTGMSNFANFVLAPAAGGIVNDLFVDVTNENLSSDNFVFLIMIECGCSLLPFLFMFLIPLRSSVEKL